MCASSFISEALKLKSFQTYLEKNENLENFLFKFGGELNLANYFSHLEQERQFEVDKMTKDIKDVMGSIKERKNRLKNEDIQYMDLKEFKKGMVQIQEHIQNLKLKLKSNTENLLEEEQVLQENMDTYNQKLKEWEKPQKYFCLTNRPIIHGLVSIREGNYMEAEEFFDFVTKSNGHENGWSSEDHQLFLKFRLKHKDVDELATQLHKLLPDISEDDVRKHEIWYKRYRLLKHKKNEALKKWREEKKKDNDEVNCIDEKNEDCIKKVYTSVQDEDRKLKLAEWKAQKNLRRQREEEIKKLQEEKIKQSQENRRKLNEEVRKSIDKWKNAKIAKEETEKLKKIMIEQREKKSRAAVANKMVKKFQSRDDIYITKMRNQQRNEQKVKIRRTNSSQIVKKDPQRIFKPTQQWLHRTSKDNENAPTGETHRNSNVKLIQKLAIPEWRKNKN